MNATIASRLALVLLLGLAAAGCSDSGSKAVAGPPGPPGAGGPPGPPGPPGGSGGVPIGSADRINITVTSVNIPAGGGAPVVKFRLSNDLTQGLVGLPAGDVRFVLSELSPGVGGGSSQWQSYITRASVAARQATTETASAARFIDNNDGTYQYTFASALSAYVGAPVFDATKTHRLGIEIRNQAPITGNGVYDFVPAGGAPTFTRLIVDNDTCNACHDVLNFHGGPRTDVTYCVTCHNPSSIDGDTGNTVDMKRLVHNIHSARPDYQIVGFGGVAFDWADVEFPQDIRNCQTCHQESDADTPQASNYRLVSNRAACGTCHYDDGIAGNGVHDFAIENGVHPGGFTFTDDTQCVDCHGPNGTVTNSEGRLVQVPVAHEVRTRTAGAKFKFNILSVSNTAPGQFPSVTFSVTDPTNANAAYNIQSDAPFTVCAGGASRMSIDVAWSTTDYTNTGGLSPALPIQLNPLTACGGASTNNGNGTFTVTSALAIPATAVGSAAVAIEGHPALDADNNGSIDRIAVTNAIAYAPITDATAVARRAVVNITKCDECHNQLSLHGSNRTDKPEVCATCHNPNMTDINRRVAAAGNCATGTTQESIDLKRMIHKIHASGEDGSGRVGIPVEICGFGNNPNLFEVLYPGRLKNCEGCHQPNTYYPVDTAKVLGTTVDVGANRVSPTDDVVISANTSVCSACHITALAGQHMIQNGGDFTATKAADSTLISSGVETCQLCHGPGRIADVKTLHGVGTFQFN